MNIRNIKFIGAVLSACVLSAQADVVAFKDAAKIKSWDAWNAHKKPTPPKERPCVTWAKGGKTIPENLQMLCRRWKLRGP